MIDTEKKKYKIVKMSENINPDFSVTHIRGTIFNIFREADDYDLGNHHRENIQSYGFSRKDLDYVKKHGTTNFKRIK